MDEQCVNNQNIYYWNTTDNSAHTHKRLEWAIKNEYLVCCNITIPFKTINNIKINDIILAYEPKSHSTRSDITNDKYCLSCKKKSLHGVGGFVAAFIIKQNPIIINSYDEEKLHVLNGKIPPDFKLHWMPTPEHMNKYTSLLYDSDTDIYYKNGGKKYLFPVSIFKILSQPIITKSKNSKKNDLIDSKYYYEYPLIKGFGSVVKTEYCAIKSIVYGMLSI